jgi:hypothetical protein
VTRVRLVWCKVLRHKSRTILEGVRLTPKKQKKGKKTPKVAAPVLAPLLTAEGPFDAMALTLTWNGGDARLLALTDNGDRVRVGEKQGTAEGGLTLRWNSPDAFSHVLQWDLAFTGTRTELRAVATVNGAGAFERQVESSSRTDRWKASGTVEE